MKRSPHPHSEPDNTHSSPMHLFAEIVAEIPNADGEITFDFWYQLNANGGGTTTLTAP
jgi:hypothetical protein